MRVREFDVGGRSVTDGQVCDHIGGFWHVVEVLPGDRFACFEVETERVVTGFRTGLGAELPWNSVGVKK